jgi:MFS family permease
VSRPYLVLRHHPEFRRLWAAQLLSMVGTQIQSAAAHWHIYLLTGSPIALGALGLSRVLPIIVFSLLGGVVADRHDRRKVMLLTQSVMALLVASLAALTLLGRDDAVVIYLVYALMGSAWAFDNPARQSLVPRLVPLVDLPSAITVNLTAGQLAQVAGPALAGLLIAASPAASAAGAGAGGTRALGWLYAIDALSFLVVIAALVRLRAPAAAPAPAQGGADMWASLREGLRFVFRTPLLVWTMGLDFVATFFSGALSLLPIVADRVLGVGAAGYGWLMAAPACGALVGSLITSARALPRRQGRLLLATVAAYGLATVVYGVSRSFALTLLALAGTGLFDLISTVIRNTLRQTVTPDALRGRMTAVSAIFFMGGPQLGEMEAGVVAGLFASQVVGVTASVVSGGLLTMLAAAWVALRAPAIVAYEGPPTSSSAS